MMSYYPSCANISDSVNYLSELNAKYADQGIEFLLLDSSGAGRIEASERGLGLPLLDDAAQLVSASLQIEHAGEVLVFNPERLSLFYRGAANQFLDTTLQTLLDGDVDDTVKSDVAGCTIEYPMRDKLVASPPDYTTEVAPIIIENCAECHRWGGAGPFALDSYISLLGWSPMIREVILNKRMPPAQVDPEYGHSKMARYLDDDEIETVVTWIDARAPRGAGAEDPLETHAARLSSTSEFGWQLGKPDRIVAGPSNAIPSTGVMDYIYEDVDLGFEGDRWLRAFQYNPGKETVLHHLDDICLASRRRFLGRRGRQRDQSRAASWVVLFLVTIQLLFLAKGREFSFLKDISCPCSFTT